MKRRITAAENECLPVETGEAAQCTGDEVNPFLAVEAADEDEEWNFWIQGKLKFFKESFFIGEPGLQMEAIKGGSERRIGGWVPGCQVEPVEDAQEGSGTRLKKVFQTAAEFGGKNLAAIGRRTGPRN